MVAEADIFLKVAGHCDEIKICLEAEWIPSHIKFWLTFQAVSRVLKKNVGELFSDVVEIIRVSKTEVVDAIAKIENVPLHFQSHDDIFVLVSGDVEISWHSIDFKEAVEVAALIFIHLISDSVFNLTTPNIFIHCIFG